MRGIVSPTARIGYRSSPDQAWTRPEQIHRRLTRRPTTCSATPADAKSVQASGGAAGQEAEVQLGFAYAAGKVREFPQTPGVYLMKDAAGVVIYVGKAVNLRSRAGSYFLKAAAEEHRTADLVREIADIDFLEADSEVDALLIESRLIKDVQPKYNRDLKDDKSFPYLEIFIREDFPRVEFTREPQERGTKLYGPFASAGSLRGGNPGAAKDLQVSHL